MKMTLFIITYDAKIDRMGDSPTVVHLLRQETFRLVRLTRVVTQVIMTLLIFINEL